MDTSSFDTTPILSSPYLSDEELDKLCETNPEYKRVSCREDFWYHRSIVRLPPRLREKDSRSDIIKHLSWKEWYNFWRNHLPDPISEMLNLSAEEAYIRQVTADGGLLKGSEKYQGVNKLLIRALNRSTNTDFEMVEYLMPLFLAWAKELKATLVDQSEIVSYDKELIAAIQLFHRTKEERVREYIHKIYSAYSSHEYFYDVAYELGFLNEEITLLPSLGGSPHGYAEGHHDRERNVYHGREKGEDYRVYDYAHGPAEEILSRYREVGRKEAEKEDGILAKVIEFGRYDVIDKLILCGNWDWNSSQIMNDISFHARYDLYLCFLLMHIRNGTIDKLYLPRDIIPGRISRIAIASNSRGDIFSGEDILREAVFPPHYSFDLATRS